MISLDNAGVYCEVNPSHNCDGSGQERTASGYRQAHAGSTTASGDEPTPIARMSDPTQYSLL